MKTLVFGAGPIGRWLAYRLELTGQDVTLFARNQTYHTLKERGLEIVDGLTAERFIAPVKLVDSTHAESEPPRRLPYPGSQ